MPQKESRSRKTKGGKFIKRLNRFTCLVEVDRATVLAYLPNSGRLDHVLIPGLPVLLLPKPTGLPYKLLAIKHNEIWVSLDAHLVNDFLFTLFKRKALPFLKGWNLVAKERTVRNRRIDFIFTKGGKNLLLEVKSCTLVENGIALFPDSPTKRGVEHLEILADNVKLGNHSFIVFVVQREDAKAFSPNARTHPLFAEKFIEALKGGVKSYYIVSRFNPRTLSLEFIRLEEISPEGLPF